jgi:hypothetical protein
MCHCLKINKPERVTFFTLCDDCSGYNGESVCGTVALCLCCFTGIPCLVCVEHVIQINVEDACCPANPCCSKCLDEYCYEKTDREITGTHKNVGPRVSPSDVAPSLVNRF